MSFEIYLQFARAAAAAAAKDRKGR